MTSLVPVHTALLERGFAQVKALPELRYRGNIRFKGRQIPVELVIYDRRLVKLPAIQLLEIPSEIPKVCCHINHLGYLCYLRDDQAYLARSNLGGMVLGCLELAERLLERLANGDALTDFQHEFPVYWAGQPLLMDIPGETGSGLLSDIALLELPDKTDRAKIFIVGRNIRELSNVYKAWGPEVTFFDRKLRIIDTDQPLGAMSRDWPPRNLQDLKDWLAEAKNPAVRGLMEAVKDAYDHDLNLVLLIIRAPNTSCGIMIDTKLLRHWVKCRNSATFMRRVFQNGEKREPDANGRMVSKSWAAKAEVTRLEPIPADPRSWLTRNLADDNAGLAGKRILLLGCGAIGGFLADLLAKSGAGFLGGKLLLSDPDKLSIGNIGRHILGFSDLERTKTTAIREQLEAHYPRIDVGVVTDDLLDGPSIQGVDLIIDATGNQGLSLFLNELKVSGQLSAAIVFAWIAGAGCGAQAYLFSSTKEACLNCLDYSIPGGNFSVMRKEYQLTLKNSSGSCGDWLVPFSASAAVHAAALAIELAISWAKGKPNPRLRSITLDSDNGKMVKPNSPSPMSGCLVCAQSH